MFLCVLGGVVFCGEHPMDRGVLKGYHSNSRLVAQGVIFYIFARRNYIRLLLVGHETGDHQPLVMQYGHVFDTV